VTDFTGDETLIILIHGESGVGKTPVSHTAPAPRLVLDSENGSRFVKGARIKWDPNSEAPPVHDGTWETCVVQCRDFQTFLNAYAWLNSGQHPFRSVLVDSLTELQKRCKDQIKGTDEVVNERQWGILLDRMEKAVRELRDLTMHPTNPIQAVVLLALTDDKTGKFRPLIQGALGKSIVGFVDVIGYLYVDSDDQGLPMRKMLVQPIGPYVAKDRTSELPSGGIVGTHGASVPGPINLSSLIDQIYTNPAAA
jgi:hypothetical protein